MEWMDQGILLSVRRHGEGAAIIEVLTENHGRHAGLVRGGGSRKMASVLQTGNQISLTWRARIEDQLGAFSVELLETRSGVFISDRKKLYIFNALSSMLGRYLPEREPNAVLYNACMDLLERMCLGTYWQHRYCLLEFEMLDVLGYGADRFSCAVTGGARDLGYISPMSGRAVSRKGAVGYENRLLPYPKLFAHADLTAIPEGEFYESLRVSGYFFENKIPTAKGQLPQARQRLMDLEHAS
jgi:DNA repair protein RecO (recombination protein O)